MSIPTVLLAFRTSGRTVLLLSIAMLFSASCDWDKAYVTPIAKHQNLKIERTPLGTWTMINKDGKPAGKKDNLVVFRFSESEYLVRLGDLNLRGYPIRLNGQPAVQLELIGDDSGDHPDEDERDRYFVVSTEFQNNTMIIRLLNPVLINHKESNPDSLQANVTKHKDHADLWVAPLRFVKSPAK